MSRSIHETRRMLRDAQRAEWSDPEDRKARLDHLKARLSRKTKVKRQIAEERHGRHTLRAEEEIILNTDPAAIPIIIEDEGPNIHYPASPEDLRAVMRRLPQGVCDGLTSIVLCLGARRAPTDWELKNEFKSDPYTGRIGQQMLPGVWARGILGEYYEDAASIRMNAYVYPLDLKERGLKEYLLRLRALSTFVHEVAHHHDFTRRGARGRWIPEEGDSCEDYAGDLQYEWLHQVVVPYLMETYPREAAQFIEWVEYYGGVRLTLDQMAGDPRKCIYDLQPVLFFLVEWVEEDEVNTEAEFADFIHMCGYYTEALSILEKFLAEDPNDVWSLRLKANILTDQGWILEDEDPIKAHEHYENARTLALRIIELDPEYAEAWGELWYACERLERWEDVITAVTREFELEGSDLKRYGSRFLPRIRARLALGDFAGAEADIQLLEQSSSKHMQNRAKNYRLKMEQARASHDG